MNKQKPFVHLFKTISHNYIYDVNTNVIIKSEDHEYKYLEYFLYNKENTNLSMEDVKKASLWIESLQEQGFLSNKRGKKIKHYLDNYLEGILSSNMENLILQVTQACNLRCKYCTYSGDYLNRTHSQLSMPEEIAKKAIDFYIANSHNTPNPSLGFYGGEPFITFGMIKNLTHYIKERMRGKEYSIHITTNGTLLNEEIMNYLVDNNVSLMISLDGPREVHDLNRCFASGQGTFDVIMQNMEKFSKIAPEYVNKNIMFSSVFTKEINFCSLSKFFANFETIKDLNVIGSTPNTYYLKNDDIQKKLNNLKYDDDIQYESLKYYLSKMGRIPEKNVSKLVKTWEDKVRSDMEEKRMEEISLRDEYHPSGPCVPGSRRLFVTINGDFLPCERVSETSKITKIGSIYTGIDIEKARKLLNIGTLTESECLNCWAARFCTSCVASADDGETFNREMKLSYCKNYINDAESKLRKYCICKEFNIPTEKDYDIKYV